MGAQRTGKEEDVEVGLHYFGKRYYAPLLNRWVSADPLAVHAPGEADLNVYAYIRAVVLKATDPFGLDCVTNESCDATATTPEGGVQYGGGAEATVVRSTEAPPARAVSLATSESLVRSKVDASGVESAGKIGDGQSGNGGSGGGDSPRRPSDAFVYGSYSRGRPFSSVVEAEVEVVGILGYRSGVADKKDSGWYSAGIVAPGLRLGGESNYVEGFSGVEGTYDLDTGEKTSESIALLGGGFGPFAGGMYETKDESGLYFGVQGGILGKHGSVGIGFSLQVPTTQPANPTTGTEGAGGKEQP